MNRPAAVTVAPKPKPALVGTWTNWGIRMNEPNMQTDEQRRDVGRQDRAPAHHPHVDERLRGGASRSRIQASVKAIARGRDHADRRQASVQPQVSPSLTGIQPAP